MISVVRAPDRPSLTQEPNIMLAARARTTGRRNGRAPVVGIVGLIDVLARLGRDQNRFVLAFEKLGPDADALDAVVCVVAAADFLAGRARPPTNFDIA